MSKYNKIILKICDMITNKSGDKELEEVNQLLRDAILMDQLSLIKNSYEDLIAVYKNNLDDFNKNNYDKIVESIYLDDRVDKSYLMLINKIKQFWYLFDDDEKNKIGTLVKRLIKEALNFKIDNKL